MGVKSGLQGLVARHYDGLLGPVERGGLRDLRAKFVSRAAGRVIEIGAGSGLNLEHYDAEKVKELICLEPDPNLAEQLRERITASPLNATVVEATIDDVELELHSFDFAVTTFVLCCVPDQDLALDRTHDLLTEGGQFVFIEHVRSPGWRGIVQKSATPLWKHAVFGCHMDRDTVLNLRRHGFAIDVCDKQSIGAGPVILHDVAAGVARSV